MPGPKIQILEIHPWFSKIQL